MEIYWEGECYESEADNFVTFLEDVGIGGRDAILSILLINYREEVRSEVESLYKDVSK